MNYRDFEFGCFKGRRSFYPSSFYRFRKEGGDGSFKSHFSGGQGGRISRHLLVILVVIYNAPNPTTIQHHEDNCLLAGVLNYSGEKWEKSGYRSRMLWRIGRLGARGLTVIPVLR